MTDKDKLIRQDLSHLFEIVKNKLRAFSIRDKARGRLAADADEDRLLTSVSPLFEAPMLMQGEKKPAAGRSVGPGSAWSPPAVGRSLGRLTKGLDYGNGSPQLVIEKSMIAHHKPFGALPLP